MPPVIDLGELAIPAAYAHFMHDELACYQLARASKFCVAGRNVWNQYLLSPLEEGEQVASDVQVREAQVDYGKDHAGFFVRGEWTTLRKPRIDPGFGQRVAQRLAGIVDVLHCKQSHVLMSAVSVRRHIDKIDEFHEIGVVIPYQASPAHGLKVGQHIEWLKPLHAYAFNLHRPHALIYTENPSLENLESQPAALVSVCFIKP